VSLRDIWTYIDDGLKVAGADYVEIRVQIGESTEINFRGSSLDVLTTQMDAGGAVRVLVKGSWGFTSFNELKDIPSRVRQAVEQAKTLGGGDVHLAEVSPVIDSLRSFQGRDPLTVPLEQKVDLLREYVEIVRQADPRIQTALARYREVGWKQYLATSEGTRIEDDRRDMALVVTAVAKDAENVQRAFVSVGDSQDFDALTSLHHRVQEAARLAVSLLDAPPVKGGVYPVVLDGTMTGLFAHEAFGHLSEADHVHENPKLRELMVIGKRFGPAFLNLADGADLPGFRGSYRYDDEGVPSRKTYLIKDGVLVGRLHSRETAARMGEAPTGNARAINYRWPPIVRMTNTYIEPGQASLEDLLEGIREGVFVRQGSGGETAMEMFTFTASEAYMIRNGRIAELVRNVSLTGNVFETLMEIEAIGREMAFHTGGGCGKGGQVPLPVTTGGPAIKLRRCTVGGE
jgi:TldD protein